jgi:hypothetical protein
MYRLERYEHELKSSEKGKEILELITCHLDEVTKLINHNRDVMVTWQRNKGAVFFSQFMGSGFDDNIILKKNVEGIQLTSLLRRMAAVLQDHGSASLVNTIDEYFLRVLAYAENVDSMQQIFQKLRTL